MLCMHIKYSSISAAKGGKIWHIVEKMTNGCSLVIHTMLLFIIFVMLYIRPQHVRNAPGYYIAACQPAFVYCYT